MGPSHCSAAHERSAVSSEAVLPILIEIVPKVKLGYVTPLPKKDRKTVRAVAFPQFSSGF